MVGARRAVTSMVGASVPDGREMRAAADDQRLTGQPRAIVNKNKHISQSLNQSNFACTVRVRYRNQRQGLYFDGNT